MCWNGESDFPDFVLRKPPLWSPLATNPPTPLPHKYTYPRHELHQRIRGEPWGAMYSCLITGVYRIPWCFLTASSLIKLSSVDTYHTVSAISYHPTDGWSRGKHWYQAQIQTTSYNSPLLSGSGACQGDNTDFLIYLLSHSVKLIYILPYDLWLSTLVRRLAYTEFAWARKQ